MQGAPRVLLFWNIFPSPVAMQTTVLAVMFFQPGLSLNDSLGDQSWTRHLPRLVCPPFSLSLWPVESRAEGTQEGYVLVWTKPGGGQRRPLAGPGSWVQARTL